MITCLFTPLALSHFIPFSLSFRHSIQQQTNKVITSTSQLVKQLTDIISGSSRVKVMLLWLLNLAFFFLYWNSCPYICISSDVGFIWTKTFHWPACALTKIMLWNGKVMVLSNWTSDLKNVCYFVFLQQDRLRLTRLKTELSDSVQRYGDLQKVHMKYWLSFICPQNNTCD